MARSHLLEQAMNIIKVNAINWIVPRPKEMDDGCVGCCHRHLDCDVECGGAIVLPLRRMRLTRDLKPRSLSR